jgi:hypothetical protein
LFFNQKAIVAFKNQILLQVSNLSHSIFNQYISLSFLIISKASASLISQLTFFDAASSKYGKISLFKTYFPTTQFLDFVSFALGFSKNLSTTKLLPSLRLVSITQ